MTEHERCPYCGKGEDSDETVDEEHILGCQPFRLRD